ncbi:ATP12 family chaperone protein [Rhizobium paknamense]|uniref:Chaperone required for assembly of F1-ATPase n=1 Tax=Rhizobium paknamense TaxID=1206817 RepID=A0ABU0IF51_9HYPH|nr:ATP12 family protein [Rhizobium paknamense]MDQ0455886.1 chaperone required for assembly of F1-ATPase [Rhizobium paknamense]
MRDIFEGVTPEMSDPDPVRRAQIQMKRPLPKRFYAEATVSPTDAGFAVTLDGRAVKTPARNTLILPTSGAAELVAEEWRAQGEEVDPATMPVTRLTNTAIDAVSKTLEEVLEDIVRFSSSDLLCYRAEDPQELVERQSARWNPVLAWLNDTHGVKLITISGIMHQEQPAQSTSAFRRALERYGNAFQLAALHVVTTLTGSAALTLALADGFSSLEEVWALAHLDEDWTNEHWGVDEEAAARREARLREMQAAWALFNAVQT